MGTAQVSKLLEQQGRPPSPPPPPWPPSDCERSLDATANIIKYQFTSFDRTSLANVGSGSSALWMHLCLAYIVTAVTLKASCPNAGHFSACSPLAMRLFGITLTPFT